MVNISLTLYTKGFFGSFLKSLTQMGSLNINNSVTNISRLGTFNNCYPTTNICQTATNNIKRQQYPLFKNQHRQLPQQSATSNSEKHKYK
jgi:hypothetical protein